MSCPLYPPQAQSEVIGGGFPPARATPLPPQLMGIVPGNTGGFGAVLPAAQVFARNEIEPLQARLSELSYWLDMEVLHCRPYVVDVEEEDGRSPRVPRACPRRSTAANRACRAFFR